MIVALLISLGCSSTAESFQLGSRTTPSTTTTESTTEPPPPIDTAPTGDTALPEVPCLPGECADVLFVIDSSRSMDDSQQQLVESTTGFFETLGGLRFHVGVVSMDLTSVFEAGALQPGLGERFFSETTPDAVAAFADAARLGIGGASSEAGIGAARLAIFEKPDTPDNEGFRREGAALHLVFVSDEDDQTDPELVADATARFGELGAQAHALVAYTFARGQRYLDLSETLGGHRADIEDGAFEVFLDEVAQRIVAP